mmetsp:Transcript_30702/g.49340  ORF Transcript_30702/g.49340 Transcript_30702/m.49340 type:complete len:378 (-) Transcript_30702:286-1419(-)
MHEKLPIHQLDVFLGENEFPPPIRRTFFILVSEAGHEYHVGNGGTGIESQQDEELCGQFLELANVVFVCLKLDSLHQKYREDVKDLEEEDLHACAFEVIRPIRPILKLGQYVTQVLPSETDDRDESSNEERCKRVPPHLPRGSLQVKRDNTRYSEDHKHQSSTKENAQRRVSCFHLEVIFYLVDSLLVDEFKVFVPILSFILIFDPIDIPATSCSLVSQLYLQLLVPEHIVAVCRPESKAADEHQRDTDHVGWVRRRSIGRDVKCARKEEVRFLKSRPHPQRCEPRDRGNAHQQGVVEYHKPAKLEVPHHAFPQPLFQELLRRRPQGHGPPGVLIRCRSSFHCISLWVPFCIHGGFVLSFEFVFVWVTENRIKADGP